MVEGVDENVETLDNGTRERKNSSGDKERDKERKHKKHKRHRSRSRYTNSCFEFLLGEEFLI